jgi:hypothetical protein
MLNHSCTEILNSLRGLATKCTEKLEDSWKKQKGWYEYLRNVVSNKDYLIQQQQTE